MTSPICYICERPWFGDPDKVYTCDTDEPPVIEFHLAELDLRKEPAEPCAFTVEDFSFRLDRRATFKSRLLHLPSKVLSKLFRRKPRS